MKKTKLICLSLLGLLFIIPFINFSTANDYVGVNVGDKFTWKISVNANTMETFFDDAMNETFEIPPELLMFEEIPSINIKGEVVYIFPEDSILIDSTTLTYVKINVSLLMSVPGYVEMPLSDYPTPFIIFSNETANYAFMSIMYLANASESSDFAMPFLFVASNLNWTLIVEELEGAFGSDPLMSNLTITEELRGLKLTIPEALLNETQKAMEVLFTYTSKGVLELAKISYGGATLISFSLSAEEELIPGYELPIIIGVSAVTIGGLIYYVKRKKR